jgi:RimJ/RimL family protein N-acetyltransferase
VIVTGMDDIVGPWVCQRAGGTWLPGRGSTIGLARDNQLIAGVLYEDWNGANVVMHVAAEGKNWLNREFLRVCFDYPFNQLKCKRVTGIVPSSNGQALKFDKHLGFRVEARLKDAHPEGDLMVLSMNREQCKWIDHGKSLGPSST